MLVASSLLSLSDVRCRVPKAPGSLHPVRVIIADASGLKSQLMVAALQRGRQRIAAVGSAVDSAGIRQLLEKSHADVAVIDSALKDGPIAGLEVAREVRVSYPGTRIITTLDSSASTLVVEAFRAGADGVLSRDDPFEVLCKCIHAVHEGQVWANSEQLHFVTEALAKSAPSNLNSVLGAKLLTQREEGLVQLVSQGLTNREISKQLKLSEHTVRNYLFRIFNKLGTSNRLELALYSLHRTAGAVASPPPDNGSHTESSTHARQHPSAGQSL